MDHKSDRIVKSLNDSVDGLCVGHHSAIFKSAIK
jgi:hypothetical protein